MASVPLFDPAEFRIPAGTTHVCAGGETPFLLRHDEALRHYARDKSAGPAGRHAQEAEVARTRRMIAATWGVDLAEIGLVGNVAEGVSMIAESIPWRPGDNAVFDPDEYPSVVAPFAMRRQPQVELRFVPFDDPARVAKAVDRRTRVIGVSHVSFLTGRRHDLAGLRWVADSVGAMLVVDHTQAAGYLPIHGAVADFAFAATYKWMLGTTGVAVAYWNRARQPDWTPTTAGWHSVLSNGRPDYRGGLALQPDATRFTRGNPAHGPVYVLGSALDYLGRFETPALERHVQALTMALLTRMREAEIPSTTPFEAARHGASVCIESPQAAAIVDGMARRGVLAWNGRGRIRFSFHGYNSLSDVDRIMEALIAEWRA
jgi:selenocysteine lyase/cysteine desulfurase